MVALLLHGEERFLRQGTVVSDSLHLLEGAVLGALAGYLQLTHLSLLSQHGLLLLFTESHTMLTGEARVIAYLFAERLVSDLVEQQLG